MSTPDVLNESRPDPVACICIAVVLVVAIVICFYWHNSDQHAHDARFRACIAADHTPTDCQKAAR